MAKNLRLAKKKLIRATAIGGHMIDDVIKCQFCGKRVHEGARCVSCGSIMCRGPRNDLGARSRAETNAERALKEAKEFLAKIHKQDQTLYCGNAGTPASGLCAIALARIAAIEKGDK